MTAKPLDPNSTELRPLAEYTHRLASSHRGKSLNRATLWRWALRGLRDGRYLRTVGLGSGRFTCDKWVWEFLAPPPNRASTRATTAPRTQADRAAQRARIAGNGSKGAA